jgi:tetratricopeptide (TPR) repeat protein
MKCKIIILVLLSLTFSLSAQKSKVLAVKQMIDAGKYSDAKEEIDMAVKHRKTSVWPRTYFIKGLLCQTAYETGKEKNDSKMTSLYPDQLYVAYESYEMALELDARERLHGHISLQYYSLINDFKSLGEELYNKKDYAESFRAFDHALLISKNELVITNADTSLIYNTAMAAFEGGKWDKATFYLTELHESEYSTDASLLLAMAWQNYGDSLQSEKVLNEAMERFNYEESVVVFLANYLARTDRLDATLDMLNKAIVARPDNFIYIWARGLVYRRMNKYDEAIADFHKAAELAPDTPTLFYHIGVSYYNIGIDLRHSALSVSQNDEYRKIREQYLEKFREAVKWLEKAYELDPANEQVRDKLNQLYYQLDMREEQEALDLVN